MSLVFRGNFMAHMKKACQREHIKIAGDEFNLLKILQPRWMAYGSARICGGTMDKTLIRYHRSGIL